MLFYLYKKKIKLKMTKNLNFSYLLFKQYCLNIKKKQL